MSKKKRITPLMQQFHEIKQAYPDVLLFFQVGDFYELFFDDAKKASAFLGITLTTRGKHLDEDIPLCGVPVHALNHYLVKLVKGGFKVAICDQLEAPQPGKVVKRGVTKVLTPGTLTDETLLDEKTASYVCAVMPFGERWSIAFSEILTGQLFVTEVSANNFKDIERELARFLPEEVLLPHDIPKNILSFFVQQGFFISHVIVSSEQEKRSQVWISSISSTIKKNDIDSVSALGLLFAYFEKNMPKTLEQFTKVHNYNCADYVIMDAATLRHLEIVANAQDRGKKNTLFALLDSAATAMGSRLLKKWIVRPLINKEAIERRLDVITHFSNRWHIVQDIRVFLKQVGDVERIIGRISLNRSLLQDYVSLMRALSVLPQLKKILFDHSSVALVKSINNMIVDFSSLYGLLHAALNSDPEKDWIIKQGFDTRLDELRQLIENSNQLMLQLEQKEQQKTGINSLKIRFNQVHGYYIEVTKPNIHLVPDYYKRYQTLVAKERFTTAELKELEQKIVQAQSQIKQVEQAVFESIKSDVAQYIQQLRRMAQSLAHIDVLCAFSSVSYNLSYVRPDFSDNNDIIIKEGRHPVVEQHLQNNFIANDTQLSDEQSLFIITGPNMGGKSTYLRQVALICIMAQCGMFVPAQSANLSILDRIFTRIGASDNVAEGKSTFLVEMEETAYICNNATKKSLVILDEVGRGTSTFDGLAIAQAVVEYLYSTVQSRCLFATHYHELTLLKDKFPAIACFHAASKKTEAGILLLHKIQQGVADGSFGIEVAKLAQLPTNIIKRSQEIAYLLQQKESLYIPSEKDDNIHHLLEENIRLKNQIIQLQHSHDSKDLLKTLNAIDFDDLSPKKAFDLLWSFKKDM